MAELQLPGLSIEIRADGSIAIREMERVEQAAKRTTEEVSQTAEKVGSGLSKYVTLPIVGLYTAATKGAADLVETVGKTQVVFGEFYDQIDQWSQSSIQTMGVARSTALDMASLYGDMATGMGFSKEAAADMSMELTRLAADMASFKNISIDMAQTALKSVFTGETESLKNLGVVMTQANLQAYALSQGIEKNIASMTQAEQVTLRYNYVMAQTANAQGDFARTGDSLSNQSRKLAQTVKQLGETAGTLLIPKVTSVVVALQSAAQWVAELDDGTKNIILTIGAVVAAAGPLMLVGSKALKLITGIKAALAASTLNPIVMGVAGITAAAGLLLTAIEASKTEIDETTASYQRMKQILSGGIQTKVNVDADELDGIEDKTVTITLTASGEAALNAARETIDRLKSDEYRGMLTIDGDTGEADAALDALESAVNAMLAGNGSLSELQAAVDKCKKLSISPEIDAQKRLELEGALADLRGELIKIGKVGVSFEYEEQGDASQFQAFIDRVNELGWESKTFTATGVFEVSDATIDEIRAYSNALAAAATATGDYGSAVDALNKLLDQRLGEQLQEITDQADASIREQAVLYNNGIIDEATYNAQVKTIMDGAQQAKEALEQEANQAKELNDVLNNGQRSDDYGYIARQYAELYQGETISNEDWQGAVAHLKEAAEAGEDLTASQTEAAVALEGLKQRSVESYNQMIAAKQAYDQAMSSADDKEAQAQEADNMVKRADAVKEYVGQLQQTLKFAESTQEAIESVVSATAENEEQAAEIRKMLTELMSDDEGELVNDALAAISKASEVQKGLENEANKAVDKARELRTEAETARTEATETFSSSMEQIQNAVGLSQTAIGGLLEAIASAGVSIDSADAEMIAGISGLIEAAAGALEDGRSDVADGVSAMLGGVNDRKSEAEGEGKSVGAAIAAGMTAGLESGSGALYRKARSIVNESIRQMKSAAQIHSPSQRVRDEVGRMFMRGFSEGVEDEMPALLSGIGENMDRIVSGAQQVVNRGAYTLPQAEPARTVGIDYQRMSDALSEAVMDRPAVLVINDKVIAQTTSEATARQQATRAQRINQGKGRW